MDLSYDQVNCLVSSDNIGPLTSTPVKSTSVNLVDISTDSEASCLSPSNRPRKRSINLLDISTDNESSYSSPIKSVNLVDFSSIDDASLEIEVAEKSVNQDLSFGFSDNLLSISPIDGTQTKETEGLSSSDNSNDATLSAFTVNNSDQGTSQRGGSLADNHENTQETHVGSDSQEVHSSKVQAPTIATPRDVRLRTEDEIMWLFSTPCCLKRCLHQLSIGDIQHVEVILKERNQTEKRNFLLDFLHQHSQINESGEFDVNYVIKGKQVCREAWLVAHNLPKSSFRRVMEKFKDGAVKVDHGNKGKKSVMAKTGDCIAWLQYFFNTIGDHQPDSNAIHLPSCFSKIAIYKKMLDENTQFNHPTVSLSHFYNIWDQHFRNVTIPKENRFTKCTECTRFKNLKEQHPSQRDSINKELNDHLDLVWQERRVYYMHRYKARKFPQKYMTIIDDGMDQKTTNIPKVRRISKALSSLTNVNTHLVGAIVHSGQATHGKEIYGSFDFYQWPHDSNLNMTVLLSTLMEWCKNYKLPPILYLQMDNCWRENKNQFMLALLALMVQKKIFEKIRLNFLPVGHTHEDIDAFFGVFSKYLDKNDIYTIEDLLIALECCMNNPRPKSFMLPHSYDIKNWITGHANPMNNHTKPKCFKFEANSNGEVVMLYRNWSHEEWFSPFVVLKSLPDEKPGLVPAKFEKLDPEELSRDLPKYAGHIPELACSFWQNWLENVDSLLATPAQYDWVLDILSRDAVRTEPLPTVEEVMLDVRAIREKELEPTREIYSGPYRNRVQRENPVERTDSYLEGLSEGSFVALLLANYNVTPAIGKVLEVTENNFKVHYWKGTYNGKWVPQHVPRQKHQPWVEWLPKTCIVCCNFSLTEGDKLKPTTRNFLKTQYNELTKQS